MNTHELRKEIREPYAWPGGYPKYAVTTDGGNLCIKCCRAEYRLISASVRHHSRDGWEVSGFDINWEDPALFCDHCGERIESAYAEDDVPQWFCGNYPTVGLRLTRNQAMQASHQGDCTDDVRKLSEDPDIAYQLANIDAGELAKELREYGAWSEDELNDHDANLQRILWLAAGDIVENRD